MSLSKKEIIQRRRTFTQPFYQGNRGLIALCMVNTVILALAQIAVAYLLQQLLDVATSGNAERLRACLLMMVAIVLLFALYTLVNWYAQPKMLEKANAQYKNHIFCQLTNKSISSFSSEHTSRYLSALTADATSIETRWLSQMTNLVLQLLTFVGALALMLYYSPMLTLWAILLALLPLVASVLTGSVLARREKQVSDANEHFVDTVKDTLNGFPVMKSFQAEEQVIALFSHQNAALEACKRQRNRTASVIEGLTSAASLLCQFGVFLVAAWMAVSGAGVSAGMVIAFVQMMNYIISPMVSLPNILAGYRSANALVDKIAAAVQENTVRKGLSIAPQLQEGIRLENVTFGYDQDKPVLHHVSCAWKAGGCYAVVGASGSGKSTLLNLLLGGYATYEGSIQVDGHELRELSSDSLCGMTSLVQQNVFIFHDTLQRNITMFRSFPEDEVEEVVLRSGLKPVVEAKGMDYDCGENGCGLSGGERQRVSIARSLLRHASVLLMDEATAALDTCTANEVTDAVLSLEGITRIVVTHRLHRDALRRYDGILVLRDGSVCEEGRFDELMERKGYFYSLFTVSQGAEEETQELER